MYRFATRLVDHRHYVCSLKQKDRFPADAQKFLFEENQLDSCSHAVVATRNRELIGFLRFGGGRGGIWAYGTWVHPDHRGRGIAGWLWRRALEAFDPKTIEVTTISKSGAKLVRSLKTRYPDRNWDWCDLSRSPAVRRP